MGYASHIAVEALDNTLLEQNRYVHNYQLNDY